MEKRIISPLAYLLKFLYIKNSELAAAIYVDRTLVSKWISGAQIFNKDSKHYENVVSYLVHVNETQDNKLQKFFTDYYHGMERPLQEFIDLFLHEETVLECAQTEIQKQDLNLKYSEIAVSKTPLGRYSALMQMLDNALQFSSKTKGEIILFDNQQFAWLSEDEKCIYELKEKLTALLEQGHKVTIISDMYADMEMNSFDIVVMFLYKFKNFSEYFYCIREDIEMVFSYYIWRGHITIYGHCLPGDELYTILLRDKDALLAAEQNIQFQLLNSIPYKLLTNWKQIYEVLHLINSVASNEDTIYVYTQNLSLASMSIDLLEEILEINKVHPVKIEVILRIRQTHQNNLNKTPSIFRNLCYKHNVESMVAAETYCLQGLTNLVGKPIYLSHEQIIRHIQDTIQMLECNPKFSIGLMPIDFPTSQQREYGFICKKNHYLVSASRWLRFTSELTVVNHLINKLDHIWDTVLETEDRERTRVIKWLQGLLE